MNSASPDEGCALTDELPDVPAAVLPNGSARRPVSGAPARLSPATNALFGEASPCPTMGPFGQGSVAPACHTDVVTQPPHEPSRDADTGTYRPSRQARTAAIVLLGEPSFARMCSR